MSNIRQLLSENKILFVDGATGSMLQSLGLPPGVNPAVFCMERPELVRGMHQAYLEAGADIILTPTFGGTSFKLPAGLDPFLFNKTMALNARTAVREQTPVLRRPLFVAGDIGPSGHFIQPLGDVHPNEMVEAYRQQVRGLIQGGVDLIFIETQFDLAEARAAVAAARMESDLPIFVSMTFEDGASLTGSTPEIFAATMANMGVDAVGVNCGAGPEQMLDVVARLCAACNLPVYAEPNAGLPELIDGQSVFRLGADAFAVKTAALVDKGAQVLGGCCGTTPAHISALREAVLQKRSTAIPVPRPTEQCVVLTSRSRLVRIGGDNPVALIGERINPTGKKLLSAEFQAGRFDLALRYAREQDEAGAQVLDVNVGAPGVDEIQFLPKMLAAIVAGHNLPLCLDSSNPAALAAALPWHPGSALINSISGEPGRMELLAPACRTWGMPFVLLPLRGSVLPEKAAERIAIIESLLEKIESYGLPRRLIVVDALAMTAASNQDAPGACLETLRWCAKHGLATTVGLSNISFGLPARDLVNSSFLLLAAGAGLASMIGNPGNARLREALDSANLLLGQDPQASGFIRKYATWTNTAPAVPSAETGTTPDPQARSRELSLEQAIILGEREAVTQLVENELAGGSDPYALVQEKLIPALNVVGEKYERKEYFLPQLLRSAETMQTAFAIVKPLLEARRELAERPTVVIATVEGDIHDIGKNIVGLMLGNHGFEVIDLGKDVKAESIIQQAKIHKAAIIALSALMTTTMPRMEDTIKMVRDQKLPYKIMVGGAVVTQEYADSIGADGYSEDAVDAVRLANRLLDRNKT